MYKLRDKNQYGKISLNNIYKNVNDCDTPTCALKISLKWWLDYINANVLIR